MASGGEREREGEGEGEPPPSTDPIEGAESHVAAVVLRSLGDAMDQEDRDKYAQYAYKAVRERAGSEARKKGREKRRKTDESVRRTPASCWPRKGDVDRPNPREKPSPCAIPSMPKPWEIEWREKGRKSWTKGEKKPGRNGATQDTRAWRTTHVDP